MELETSLFLLGVDADTSFASAPFLLITADLRTSRVLYLGATGLAMLVGQMLAGIQSTHVRWATAAALACLFGSGAIHNIGAWRAASELEEKFLAEMKRVEPSPPPNAEFVFHNMPTQTRGVDFHLAGLEDAIRIDFGRADLGARRADDPPAGDSNPNRPEIHVMWRGAKDRLIEILNM